ncbi:hypothetical protein EXS71_04910 [Candidatus Uhrbacteria bacterium]|nr:hypothetical protein [Candidatus Uhrbacteria bacterium]
MSEKFLHSKIVPVPGTEARRELVRQLLEREGPITKKEISAYVDGLIEQIKRFGDPREKVHFLLQDLRTDLVLEDAAHLPIYHGKLDAVRQFFRKFLQENRSEVVQKTVKQEPVTHRTFLDQAMQPDGRDAAALTREDIEAMLQPIRRAVIEELKSRLVQERSLGHIDYGDLQFMLGMIEEHEGKIRYRGNIGTVQNFSGIDQEVIARVEMEDIQKLTEEELRIREQAIRTYMTLPENKHLVRMKSYSSHTGVWVSQKVNGLQTLQNIQKISLSARDIFSVIRDCMEGARTLERNGLVLQDIRLSNLGYVDQDGEKIGLLFDLDGIYQAGKNLHVRFDHEKVNRVPEVTHEGRQDIQPSEMVYQFGLCLSEGFMNRRRKISEEVSPLITNLYMDMKAYDHEAKDSTKRRISLSEAVTRLNEIIKLLEAAPVRRVAVA